MGHLNQCKRSHYRSRRAVASLLAASSVLASASVASAVDRYFDLSTAGGLLGGSGAWDTSSQAWSSTSAGSSNPLLTWDQGADAFFNNSVVNTLTLSGTIWANSITSIQNGASGVGTVVNPASADSLLQLGGGGINSRSGQPMFMNTRVELLASQTWNLHSAMVATAAIGDGGNNLGLTKTGSSTLGLSGNNTFTGPLGIQAGAVSLYSTGSVTSAGSITIQGTSSTASPTTASVALFKVDNSAANNNDRIGDSTDVTVGRHGEFWLITNNAATTSDRIGDLHLDTGHATVSLEAGTSFLTLSASSLQRSNRATGVFRGSALGQKTTAAVARLSLDTVPTGADFVGSGAANGLGSLKTLSIVPWLIGDTQATFAGRDFVTYDTSTTLNSLRALTSNEYAIVTAASAAYSNVGENVQIGAVTLNLGAGARTFNSLLINGAANLNGAGGVDDTLTINSGALAQVNGASAAISGFSLITFGNGEAVISNVNALRLNSGVTVSAGGGLTKSGAGTLVLAADNSFVGATVINAGTLQVGAGGTTGSLGGTTAVSLHGGNLAFNRSDDFTFDAAITGVAVQGNANGGSLRHDGLGSLTLTGNNVVPGAINVTAGTLTLTGTNRAGQDIIRNGATETIVSVNVPTTIGTSTAGVATLQLAGAGSLSIANGDLKVGDVVSGAKGQVLVASGTSLSANKMTIGAINGASGAVYQSGGSVVANNVLSTPGLALGTLGGYGYYQINDGSLTVAGMVIASGAGTGVGALYQTGGEVFSNHHTYITGAGSTGSSVYYMTGGSFSAIGSNNTVYVGYTAGNAQMTIQDATFATPGDVSVGTSAGTTGVLNLNAGAVLQANKVVTDVSSGATGVRHVNFDGGTLQYVRTGTQSQLLRASGFYAVNILDGGATFDIVTSNVITVIEQPMLAPTGNGVSATTVNVADGGAGYLGAPVVQISGATGATAVANMVSDGSGRLKVGSITITAPGLDATSASYSFVGGGFTNAAIGGSLATGANATSGGIVKTGAGRLHLSKANTYGGWTTIAGGVLQLTATGSIDNSAGVIVNAGATFDLSPKTNGYSVKNLGGAGTVLGLAGKATTVATGGFLALGDSGAGDLTVSAGNVVLDGSGMKSTISAVGVADKLKITSTGSPMLSLTGVNDLQLDLAFTPTEVGQNYFLTDINGAIAINGVFESLNGTTTDLSQGAEFTVGPVSFAISYLGNFSTDNNGLLGAAGNDLVLTTTAVPEPASVGMIGLVGAALLRRRRREGRA